MIATHGDTYVCVYLEDEVLLQLLCLLLVLLADLSVGEGVQVKSEGSNLAAQLLTGRGPAGSVEGVSLYTDCTQYLSICQFVGIACRVRLIDCQVCCKDLSFPLTPV